MPMHQDYKDRLFPILPQIAAKFGTPFHIYDEVGIRNTCNLLKKSFAKVEGFREYYAVKALPNPRILGLIQEAGFGFDCSSVPELILARQAGGRGDDIMFTSNNTSHADFVAAEQDGGCILNLDDFSLLAKVPHMPETICFRYNPGERRTGNSIIGNPLEAKYGVAHEQIVEAYRAAKAKGAKRFGMHTMLASNERNYTYMVQTIRMLLDVVEWIGKELDIRFEFLNMGGGLGIPYKPEDEQFNVEALGRECAELVDAFFQKNGYRPHMLMESGRYITGPHGVLVTQAINRKEIYRTYVGVDACMSSLMRPALYGSYHHIDVPGKCTGCGTEVVDVVGSLCENNDKFAIQRALPKVSDGDLLVIHDTGAHGHAMGFNYNGKMKPQELLLRADGQVELIRRSETPEDYFATLKFEPQVLQIAR